jgi:hypothetical protein
MEENIVLWIIRHGAYWLFWGHLYAGLVGMLICMYQQRLIRKLDPNGETAHESLIGLTNEVNNPN